ncbi:MAG: hypothetical protein IMX02_04545 [Limnochordaceae bacterium]|nr:hypothetical protein [Limnochordaceae bacterium]
MAGGAARSVVVAIDPDEAVIDRPLSYAAPPGQGLPPPGTRVRVPLQRRLVWGWVVAHEAAPPGIRLKPVAAVGEEADRCDDEALDLARWMARRYLAPLGAALKVVAPPPSLRRPRPDRPSSESASRRDGRGAPPLTGAQEAAVVAIDRALEAGRAPRLLALGRDRQREDPGVRASCGLLPGCRAVGGRAGARDRAHAPAGADLPPALRRRRGAPQPDVGDGAPVAVGAGPLGGGPGRHRGPIRRLRPGGATGPVRAGRRARVLVQAGRIPALPRQGRGHRAGPPRRGGGVAG